MNKRKSVLITGGTGILGANTAAELSCRDYRVICLSRQAEKPPILNGINCEIVQYNPDKTDKIAPVLADCDYIIHAAAKTGQAANKPEDFLEFNLEFTKKLVAMSKSAKIKRFIYISTANCFTNGSLENPGNEKSGFMPWLKDSGYAWSKYLAQSYILDESRNNRFPGIVLAPTFIIGKRDNGKSSGQLVKHGKKRVVFHPPGGKSFIDAELAAKAIANALESGNTGEAYLLSGQNLTYRDFFRKIAATEGKKKLIIRVPGFVLKAAAGILNFMNQTFHTRFALDKINCRLLCLNNYFDNSKAVRELSLQKTDVVKTFSQN